MSHRDDCYSPEYARERGREDYRTGWNSPYAMGDCYEAQRAYDEGVRHEQRIEQERRWEMERREQEEIEQMYWAQQQAEEAAYMDEMYRAAEEAHYREAEYHQRIVLECSEKPPF